MAKISNCYNLGYLFLRFYFRHTDENILTMPICGNYMNTVYMYNQQYKYMLGAFRLDLSKGHPVGLFPDLGDNVPLLHLPHP